MLSPKDFLEDAEVLARISQTKQYIQERQAEDPSFGYSDLYDGENWYVDLVQEGGGTLGIALVGYTYVLEQSGIRFLKLAGTSAGAINTLLLAAAGTPDQARSRATIEHVANLDLSQLVDGDHDARKFIDVINNGGNLFQTGFRLVQVIDNFKQHLGLNPGMFFFNWMKDILQKNGIETVAQLRERMNTLPEIIQQQLREKHGADSVHDDKMAVIAADLTTETKAVFPKMAHLYYENPDEVNPAEFVRASMSVPVFFHPWILQKIPDSEPVKTAWKTDTQYEGPHPDKVMFVDGGILSNFPIDVFHRYDSIPSHPTFGIKLGWDRNEINRVDDMGFKGLIGSVFNAARLMRDLDFINSNPDFRQLVAHVDIGDHNWLNFKVSDEAKLDLFRRGAKAAADFLQTFDWPTYRANREQQMYAWVSNLLRIDVAQAIELAEREAVSETESTPAGRARLGTRSAGLTDAHAAPTPELNTSLAAKRQLESNMNRQFKRGKPFEVLWIQAPETSSGTCKHEKTLIEAIRGKINQVASYGEAIGSLSGKAGSYDLIVSTLDPRSEAPSDDFLAAVEKGSGSSSPIILYLRGQKISAPDFRLGLMMASGPLELMKKVLEILA